ncbi:MAG: hypothetical protein HUU54_08975 [Ignavibacteriaceae bacterium]|nr:hypothetical protein [Ignavibacteriaceae bacterium]
MNKPLAGLFLFIVILLSVFCEDNYAGDKVRFLVKSWNIENGLPQNTVKSLVQSSDGYIWIGTFGGVARFDGVEFTHFNTSNTPEMNTDRVLTMSEINGELWIGFEGGGIVVYKNDNFRRVKIKGIPDNESILAIMKDSENAVWIQTLSGALIRLNGKEEQIFNNVTGAEKNYYLFKDKNENIFVASGSVCLKFNGRAFILSGFDFSAGNELAIAPFFDKDNNLWVCRRDYNIQYFPGNSKEKQFPKIKLLSYWVRRINQDSNGNIWFATDKGINIFDGQTVHNYTRGDELSDNEIFTFLEDREGNYWLGTKTSGLMQLRKSRINTFRNTHPSSINNFTSVLLTRNGSLLSGINCGGISIIDKGNNHRTLIAAPSLPNECVWSLYEDSNGDLWIGTWGGGVYLLRDWKNTTRSGRIKIINVKEIAAKVVLAITEAGGSIWFGSLANGIYELTERGSVNRYDTSSGLKSNEIRSFLLSRDGSLWVGTGGGLSKIRGGKVIDFPGSESIPSKTVRALYEDDENNLWIGTYGAGLARLSNGIVSVITTKGGLYDNLVSHILEDDYGRLWMGCNRGIFAVTKNSLESFFDGKEKYITSLIFTAGSGMINSETNGGFSPNSAFSPDGRVWFPTVNGIASINTNAVRENRVPPPVKISGVWHNNEPVSHTGILELPYNHRSLLVAFTALSFTEPLKNRYSYKLAGSDDEWINIGGRREIVFEKLPPGEYTLLIRAANNSGVWSEVPAQLGIIIFPPFWLSNWFIALVVFIFILSGPSFYFWRVRIFKKKARQREELARQLIESQESERKRIAGEIHDSLAQNLLLIKNYALIALRDNKQADDSAGHLTEISTLAGEALDESRKIAQNLRPVQLDRLGLTETLKQLMSNVQKATEMKIEHEINPIDGLVEKDNEILIFRIVQEIMNNVIKHSGAELITVIISREEDFINLLVKDNGKGFDAKLVLENNTVTKGMGLTGIIERARILRGEYHINSAINGGTTIHIKIPVTKEKLNGILDNNS